MKESIGYEFFLGRAPSPGNRPMRIVGDELLVPLVGGKEDRIPLRGLVPST